MNYRKSAQNYEKFLTLNFYAIFNLIFVIFNLTTESLAAGACDRTRKVFEGVSYGEITDGINTNYTQVRVTHLFIKKTFFFFLFKIFKNSCFRIHIANG